MKTWRWAEWSRQQGRGEQGAMQRHGQGSGAECGRWGCRGRMGQTAEDLESHAGGLASVPKSWGATDS